MINEIVAVIDTYPKAADGSAKVEDASALAIAFVGVVAPKYQVDIDALQADRDMYRSLADQRGDELTALRADVDQLRSVVAQVIAQLNLGDINAAQAVLATV
jgi:hypothetical protein